MHTVNTHPAALCLGSTQWEQNHMKQLCYTGQAVGSYKAGAAMPGCDELTSLKEGFIFLLIRDQQLNPNCFVRSAAQRALKGSGHKQQWQVKFYIIIKYLELMEVLESLASHATWWVLPSHMGRVWPWLWAFFIAGAMKRWADLGTSCPGSSIYPRRKYSLWHDCW